MIDQIKLYFSLSDKHRDILRYLYCFQVGKKHKKFKSIFPSIRKIANACKCNRRTVFRFLDKCCPDVVAVMPRWRRNGSQTSNAYLIDDKMFSCLSKLDKKNFLRAHPSRLKTILNIFERTHVTPPSLLEMSPPETNPYTNPIVLEEKRYVHPLISRLGISLEDKVKASGYPEHAIVKGLEDIKWYLAQGNKANKPGNLVISRIRSRAAGPKVIYCAKDSTDPHCRV